MSAGDCSQPSSTNSTIDFSPRPSISSAPATDEMLEALEPLRRADEPAGAADVDLAFLSDGLRLAFGAMVRKNVSLARLIASEVLDDLRDNVSGTLDADAVADA